LLIHYIYASNNADTAAIYAANCSKHRLTSNKGYLKAIFLQVAFLPTPPLCRLPLPVNSATMRPAKNNTGKRLSAALLMRPFYAD